MSKETLFHESVCDTERIRFTKEQQQTIKKTLKRGIYKELHKRKFLSNAQLNELLEKNR